MPEHVKEIFFSLKDFKGKPPDWLNKDDLKFKDPKQVPEGGFYQGYWNTQAKEREGLGIVVWNDGSTYQGFWFKDQPEGKGRMVIALSFISPLRNLANYSSFSKSYFTFNSF